MSSTSFDTNSVEVSCSGWILPVPEMVKDREKVYHISLHTTFIFPQKINLPNLECMSSLGKLIFLH